jgi:hypothetical protein
LGATTLLRKKARTGTGPADPDSEEAEA